MATSIDPSQVQWDDEIDPSKVQWDTPQNKHTVYSPTEGMSNYDLAMAAAGKAQMDAWTGIKQIFGQGDQSSIDETAHLDQPLMKTTAGKAGYIGGNIADMIALQGLGSAGAAAKIPGAGILSGIANPSTYGAAAAAGAVQGAVQPVATGDSRLWNTVSGGAAGIAGNALARGANAVGGAISDTFHDAANSAVTALTNAGVPLDAAQRTGSVLLQRAKAMLSDNPLTAGAQKDFAEMQNKTVTKAFLQTIGENANAATPDVMGRAMSRMGNTYDDVFSRLNLPYDKVEQPLSHLVDQARLNLNDQQFGIVQRNVDDVLNKASQNGGVINGQQFQNIKHSLDRLSGGADTQVGEFARDIRQTLHDGLLQHATDTGNSADAALLKQTNQQWRNMRTLEGAIDKTGDGMISPARVANVMGQKANRSVSIYGSGDTTLSDLAQAANKLIPNRTPQSGTIPRALAQVGLAGAVGAGEGLYSGDWTKAAEYGAGAYLLPKAIQMGMNSQGPLSRGVMGGISAFGQKVAGQGAQAMGQSAIQKFPFALTQSLEKEAEGKSKIKEENNQ